MVRFETPHESDGAMRIGIYLYWIRLVLVAPGSFG